MNKLYAVAFADLNAIEVLAIHETPVYLNYHRRIVLIRAVQELLDRELAAVVFFRESVKKKSQYYSYVEGPAGIMRVPYAETCLLLRLYRHE